MENKCINSKFQRWIKIISLFVAVVFMGEQTAWAWPCASYALRPQATLDRTETNKQSLKNDKIEANFIIYGYGYIGEKTAAVLPRDRYELFAVVEPDAKKRQEARGKYPNVNVVEGLNQLTLPRDRDVPFILKDCSPPSKRTDVLKWCREHDVFALMEKPLGWNEEMMGWYEGYIFSVNFQEVFNPVTRFIQKYLEDNKLTIRKIQFFRMNTLHHERTLGIRDRWGVLGGSMLDKLIHDSHILMVVLFPQSKVTGHSIKDFKVCFTPYSLDTVLGREKVFLQLDGTPCPDPKANVTELADMNMAIRADVEFDGRPIEVEFISSWSGVPDYLIPPRDVPAEVFNKALMRFDLEGSDAKHGVEYSLKKQNMKYFHLETVDPNENEIVIFGNYQQRAYVKPFVYVVNRNSGDTQLIPITWELPLVNSLNAFAEWVRGKEPEHLDFARILESHRLLIHLREECLKNYEFDLDAELEKARTAYRSGGLGHQCVLTRPKSMLQEIQDEI